MHFDIFYHIVGLPLKSQFFSLRMEIYWLPERFDA
jgi:hypothetical protein